MLKITVAVVVVCLILGLGVCEQLFIHHTFNGIEERAVAIEESLSSADYNDALLLSQDLIKWWRKKRDILELTSPHNEVKDHISLLSQLEGYIQAEQYETAIAMTYAIREDADNKLNILAFRLKNVF